MIKCRINAAELSRDGHDSMAAAAAAMASSASNLLAEGKVVRESIVIILMLPKINGRVVAIFQRLPATHPCMHT